MKTRKFNNPIISGILLVLVLFSSSCSDYLDVVPDNTATIEHAFKKRVQAESYLYGIYGFLPLFSRPDNNPAFLAGEETWLFYEFNIFDKYAWRIAMGEQGTQLPLCNYWGAESSTYNLNGGSPIFTGIRDCNIFLENIHKTIDLDMYERDLWINEVKVLKAFFHFWLLNMYGPVPIIDENVEVGSSTEETMYYREPVDDVINYIVGLIDSAEEGLPLTISDVTQDMGRITRPMALALKARVLTYAASPLFNGNPDYMDVTDNRGIKLFPQSYDEQKWVKAAEAIKEAIDVCHEAGHTLFDFNTLTEAASISQETILSLQVKGAATERWNPELIWADSRPNTARLQRFGMPAFIHWNTYGHSTRSWSPTIATVKQFYSKNGVPIEEDKEWENIDPYALRTADNSHRYYIEPGRTVINLHYNREARFYGAIAFDGGKFYGNGVLLDNNMLTTEFLYGTPVAVSFNPNSHSATGYLAKKMVHRLTSLNMTSNSSSVYEYAFPVIRLADLYLLYAEVLNEIKDTPDAEVHKYIDLVRERTGLEGVADSWKNYSTKPNKPSEKDGMREIIHRERMIELAFEGQRYWDLRRWKLLKNYMNRPIEGWDIYSREARNFYKVQTLATPVFKDKDYLWPLRQGNLLKNKNLIQNPGW